MRTLCKRIAIASPHFLDGDDFTIESEIFEEKDFLHGLELEFP